MKQVDRHLMPVLQELVDSEPVVVLDGPRTAGKSFTVRQIVSEGGFKIIDLDELQDLEDLLADPTRVLSGPGLVIVDEFQRATREVLGTIKASLNRDGVGPGRFLLAGSTRTDLIADLAEYLTGRHHRLTLYPYSQAEIEGRPGRLLQMFLTSPHLLRDLPDSEEGAESYLQRAVVGGFPLAVSRGSSNARRRWFGDYVEGVTSRAGSDEGLRGDGGASLRATLQAAASTTGQLLSLTHIQQACSVDLGGRLPDLATVRAWIAALEKVHLVYVLPPWGTTLRSRVTKTSKIHVVDSGLAAYLMGVTAANVLGETKRSEAGHLLESFVVIEIVKQYSLLESAPSVGHFRTSDGQEVDVVLEDADGKVFGVEIKSAARLNEKDLAGLRFLSGKLGDRFGGGLLLHSGKRVLATSIDRVYTAPISSLWAV